jgi:hypothetical protein
VSSTPPPDPFARNVVAVVLAVGLATAVNLITVAALWNAVDRGTGLSENATQVLTTAFGGMVGLLGGYLGFKAGEAHARSTARDEPAAPEP